MSQKQDQMEKPFGPDKVQEREKPKTDFEELIGQFEKVDDDVLQKEEEEGE